MKEVFEFDRRFGVVVVLGEDRLPDDGFSIGSQAAAAGANVLTGVKEGVYVKVFGQLREFQGHKNVNAFEVYPIVDFNEVTFHMLETLHVHLINTHGEKPVFL